MEFFLNVIFKSMSFSSMSDMICKYRRQIFKGKLHKFKNGFAQSYL